jgi:hypothetical protein
MNIDRLTRLADHAESGQLFHAGFSFAVISEATVTGELHRGCLLGELPGLWPDYWKFANRHPIYRTAYVELIDRDPNTYADPLADAALFFGVLFKEVRGLLIPMDVYCDCPPWLSSHLGVSATRYEVAAGIRRFIEWKSVT